MGGRAAAAHLVVVCFVFCVVVASGLLAKALYKRYLLCVESWISNLPKWPTFAHS
jgi:hypothetical protein